jgi:threonine dehydrogenase-like Zn-dependent dehydrogenase
LEVADQQSARVLQVVPHRRLGVGTPAGKDCGHDGCVLDADLGGRPARGGGAIAKECGGGAQSADDGRGSLVVFEAIGVPGIIDNALRAAPPQTRIVVVGVCMQRDTITPFFGIGKELSLQFVLGYDPMEFAASLQSIAEGDIDVSPMITGQVDIDGVPSAFDALGNPDAHCKILVTP